MAHEHSIYDTDPHFSINPITRALKNESSVKTSVIQYDHNSERITFEIPRTVEGHDMSLCNKIEVHYINIEAATKAQKAGVYTVEDMQISPNGDDVVIFSWLVSQNATMLVGSLNFLIRFSCVAEDGTIEYAWNTAIYTGISVSSGIYNSEVVLEEYADVLAQWKQEFYLAHEDLQSQINDVAKSANNNFANILKGTANGKIVSLLGVSPIEHTINVRGAGYYGKVTAYENNYIPYPHNNGIGEKVVNNGITFVDNGDNTITAKGTATALAKYTVFNAELETPLPVGNYMLYGFDGFDGDYKDPCFSCLILYDESGEVIVNIESHKGTEIINFKADKPIYKLVFYLRVKKTVKLDGQIFYSLLLNEDTKEVYTANHSGVLLNSIKSYYPATVLISDNGNNLSVEYNKDTNKVIENLTNAILSLGGNV